MNQSSKHKHSLLQMRSGPARCPRFSVKTEVQEKREDQIHTDTHRFEARHTSDASTTKRRSVAYSVPSATARRLSWRRHVDGNALPNTLTNITTNQPHPHLHLHTCASVTSGRSTPLLLVDKSMAPAIVVKSKRSTNQRCWSIWSVRPIILRTLSVHETLSIGPGVEGRRLVRPGHHLRVSETAVKSESMILRRSGRPRMTQHGRMATLALVAWRAASPFLSKRKACMPTLRAPK